MAKYFENKFLEKVTPKPESNKEQVVNKQLKDMGIVLSENELKGLWYFDENSLPRPNLANPYNIEP